MLVVAWLEEFLACAEAKVRNPPAEKIECTDGKTRVESSIHT